MRGSVARNAYRDAKLEGYSDEEASLFAVSIARTFWPDITAAEVNRALTATCPQPQPLAA